MKELTEQQKVKKLYNLIGERGLYVNTNHDLFTHGSEEVPFGTAYKVPLVNNGSRAYSSPLLFSALTSLLNHGTMLVTGAPGIGKTTGVEYAGHFFTGTPLEEILAAEIQGHPQLTEEKMVASYDIPRLVGKGEKVVIPARFLQCPVKVLDEGNRTPADVLSIIMRLVDSGRAVYGGELLKAAPGPLYVTANYADEGTFQLTPPFLDRFDVAVMTTSPQPWDLQRIRARGDEKLNGDLEKLLEIPAGLKLDFDKIRQQIKTIPEETDDKGNMPVVSPFADFVYSSLRFSEAASPELSRATKGNAWQVNQDNAPPGHFTDSPFTHTINELSVRAVKAMDRYARAFAWFTGKDKVELSDLKKVLPYLLWHKVQPTRTSLQKDPRHANDRISFIDHLIKDKIETDYAEMRDSDAQGWYASALGAVRTGELADVRLSEEQIRDIAKRSIERLGDVDKPWAITMAMHIANEFNERSNGAR